MDMARFEIPVSGCTCFRTGRAESADEARIRRRSKQTLVDVGAVRLLAGLGALLLLAGRGGGLLASLLLLGWGLAASWGLSGGGGGLLSCLGSHLELRDGIRGVGVDVKE